MEGKRIVLESVMHVLYVSSPDVTLGLVKWSCVERDCGLANMLCSDLKRLLRDSGVSLVLNFGHVRSSLWR